MKPPFHLSARVGGLGHGLILQGVLTAKPPHGLLVQFNSRLACFSEGVLVVEDGQTIVYQPAKILGLICIQFLDPLDHSFAFLRNPLI